jgi:acetyl esterase/lipase
MPFIRWLRLQPDPPPAVHPEADRYERQVEIEHDLTYPSRYRANMLDLYIPKGNSVKPATIIWIHGGSFIGGG